ncbi:hypothetical protein PmNV_027 [Penaeus monodon nudivirus]|uniref:Uncharacterized protein n=1 Tax=Penaeus monodon nudivirus TaxID=1529056 RepID=A0A076FDT6_9VIRU|nr:hypothetical protein PmNV_027 [Penaeus monodon nudivirus]AII15815.1 hypothetical protein PmNV_027 [Penaeus monodon nudivirus]
MLYYGPEEYEVEPERDINFINLHACCLVRIDDMEYELLYDILRLQGKCKKGISPYELISDDLRREMHSIYIRMEDVNYIYDVQRFVYRNRIMYKMFARSCYNGSYLYFCIFIGSKHCDCVRCKVGIILMTFDIDVFMHAMVGEEKFFVKDGFEKCGSVTKETVTRKNNLHSLSYDALCKLIDFNRIDEPSIHSCITASVNHPGVATRIMEMIKYHVHDNSILWSEKYFKLLMDDIWMYSSKMSTRPCH